MKFTSRREFLKILGIAGAGTLTGLSALAIQDNGIRRLTILHTNDVHSRLDPYPDNDPNYPGMGGFARRATVVRQQRRLDPELLLVDAGDIFQGTPYFNMFGGKPELKLMSKMGYDASAFGNHEFDNGLDGFLEVLEYAKFPFLSANYDFSRTILKGKVPAYKTLVKNGIKVGLYGLGIDPEGLVSRDLYGDTRYLDPVEKARETEEILKEKYDCELIVCLSHLGYKYSSDRVSDVVVARNTRHTDIIVGGHTHDLLKEPAVEKNMRDMPVYIGQAGYGGVYIGLMEVTLHQGAGEKFVESNTTKIYESQGV